METHIHTREYIQALWGSSINTIGYTSSVGVQHGNTQSHKRIYRVCGREYTHRPKLGPDFGGVEDNYT